MACDTFITLGFSLVLALSVGSMSGMMSNAVGGPAAGVGGLSDISSLIEAYGSTIGLLL